MPKSLLDNGTILTLGLVGAVAAIGAAARRGVYGSRSSEFLDATGVPERLPFAPARYFKGGQDVPLERLRATRAREKGIHNARVYMWKSYKGEYDPRKPISIRPTGDGMYEVLDGNSTYANAVASGWPSIRAQVVTQVEGQHGSMSRYRVGSRSRAGSLSREDFRTSHLRGDAKKLAESIKKLVRDMNGEEPDGGGSTAFVSPAQRRRMGWSPVKGTVMVLVFDGGDLAPYMNPNYGDKAKYNAMQDLIRRMGYWTEYETGVEASVYKR